MSAQRAIFLSYASQDAEAARRIAEALRAAQVEVWFDQSELVGGDAWDQKIRKQIKDCALLIPVISRTTQGRREAYFRLEWKLADERTHLMAKGTPFLLPVTIDETDDRGALVPDSFLAVQWTKLPGGETPPVFCARVKALLDGEQGPARRTTGGADPRHRHILAAQDPPCAVGARCDQPRGCRQHGMVAAVERPGSIGRTGSGRVDPGGGTARESAGDRRQARCHP